MARRLTRWIAAKYFSQVAIGELIMPKVRMFRIFAALMLLTLGAVKCASADSPIVVDAAGHAIGYLADSNICPDMPSVALYSKSGYLACLFISTYTGRAYAYIDGRIVPPGSGEIDGYDLYFQSSGCGGQPFVSATTTFAGGFVVNSPFGLAAADFVPSQLVGLSSYLYVSDGFFVCHPNAGLSNAIPVVAASSLPTHFSLSPYPAPLYVRILPASALDDVIFFSEFEP